MNRYEITATGLLLTVSVAVYAATDTEAVATAIKKWRSKGLYVNRHYFTIEVAKV